MGLSPVPRSHALPRSELCLLNCLVCPRFPVPGAVPGAGAKDISSSSFPRPRAGIQEGKRMGADTWKVVGVSGISEGLS